MTAHVPVLTRIFLEDMERVATPDVMQRLLGSFQQWLTAAGTPPYDDQGGGQD